MFSTQLHSRPRAAQASEEMFMWRAGKITTIRDPARAQFFNELPQNEIFIDFLKEVGIDIQEFKSWNIYKTDSSQGAEIEIGVSLKSGSEVEIRIDETHPLFPAVRYIMGETNDPNAAIPRRRVQAVQWNFEWQFSQIPPQLFHRSQHHLSQQPAPIQDQKLALKVKELDEKLRAINHRNILLLKIIVVALFALGILLFLKRAR